MSKQIRIAGPYTLDHLKYDGRQICDLKGLRRFIVYGNHGNVSCYFDYTDNHYHGKFQTTEDAKTYLDRLLVEYGFQLLDQETFDKYKILI